MSNSSNASPEVVARQGNQTGSTVLRTLLIAVILLAALANGYVFYQRWYAREQLKKIPRVHTPTGLFDNPTSRSETPKTTSARAVLEHRLVPAVGSSATQNILLIGTDTRANVSAGESAKFGKELVAGARSDTIVVLRIDRQTKKAWTLSIPRDTWVHIAGSSSSNRINAAYGQGAPVLVRTIQENFDIPISHFAIVDFSGFESIVKSVGGVKVCFPKPIRDTVTGLNQPAGCHVLDPSQSIDFVRSRHAEMQQSDGTWRTDPRGDLGRIQRQQAFIRGVISRGVDKGVLNPTALSSFLPKLKSALTLDDQFGYDEIKALGSDFRSFDPNALETFVVPTKPTTIGKKAVLLVDDSRAATVVGKFGHRS